MADLRRLLFPKSIAVLGGAAAEQVVRQTRALGFSGPIWPINPTRASLGGVPCVSSIDDLPDVPDAAFVGVNRHASIESVAKLAARGCGGVVCYGSGFGESGSDELQAALVAASNDMPLLGPNCYGFVNTFADVALWPDEHGCATSDRGAAIISQSGNVAVNLTFQRRGLRLPMMVSVGNQAALSAEDVAEALIDDDRVSCVGLFVEAIRDARRFESVMLRLAAAGKPTVAVHTGRSAAGAAIAQSHTGSMSGRAAAYAALFARCGVATVETPAELVESLALLDRVGPLRSTSIVSLSCSGGEASLMADLGEPLGLDFAPFSPQHRRAIEDTLTELVAVSNPFDYHTFMWGDRTATAATFTAVVDGPQSATVLVLDSPPGADHDPTDWLTAADALGDAVETVDTARTASKGAGAPASPVGIVLATLNECMTPRLRDRVTERGLVALHGLHDGLVALKVAAQLGAPSPHVAADQPVLATVTPPAQARVVDEARAKQLLGAHGIAVPVGRTVTRAADAEAAAGAIGYPITVKALGLAHKSDVQAVHVGLASADELRGAVDSLTAISDRLLVESTVSGALAEVLVAVRRDPPVGWLITVGFGGVLTELWADVAHLLAPASRGAIRGAIESLRSAPLLTGYRGRPAADVDSLVDLVVATTDFALANNVIELELNPVLVTVDGAVAVDALLIVEQGP